MVFNLSGNRRGLDFIDKQEKRAQKEKVNPNDRDINFEKFINSNDNSFEVFVFANYDICNFTRYKKNHRNWTKLLQKFIYYGINSSTEWPMQFWKFNGDSITYRKKIQSIDELFRFIQKANVQLKNFEIVLNDDTNEFKTICIRGAIWISAFTNCEDKTCCVNNATFQKSQFGKEFVGENIDEGFRLSACSKASNLVVDPKIVYILTLYHNILTKNDRSCPLGFNQDEFSEFLEEKIDTLTLAKQTSDALKELDNTVKRFYLMEYQKCKGVWNDRSYPIFWYIEDLKKINYIYDDIVDGKILLEHRINTCKNNDDIQIEFETKRIEILKICYQVGAVDTIRELLMNLSFLPDDSSSGEFVFDTAKLYYSIACVLQCNDEKKGILILKRSKNRHHLKNVWDLIQVKHARLKITSVNIIEEYLKQMIINELKLPENIDIEIYTDKKRRTVKPWAFCNVYRNGEVHNGILCAATLDVGNTSVEDFLLHTKKLILSDSEGKYSDIKLVTYDSVDSCSEESENDYFVVDDVVIRSLGLEEVSYNSNEVYNNYEYESNFDVLRNENEFGISFLGFSLRQILEELMKG